MLNGRVANCPSFEKRGGTDREGKYKMVIFLITLVIAASSSQQCRVSIVENGVESLKPCVFPFVLKNMTFYGCTTYFDPDDRLWCSTKVDPATNEHIASPSTWGYCEGRTAEACFNDSTVQNVNETRNSTEVIFILFQVFPLGLTHEYTR